MVRTFISALTRQTHVLIFMIIIAGMLFFIANTHARGESDEEIVEITDVVAIPSSEATGMPTFLGISKYRWLTISGPLIWILLVTGIITRHIKRKKWLRKLLFIHKCCGYSAVAIATIHGMIGLFL